jgi:ABC-type multidrug transport system fused ATPase/permease subunit
VLAVRGHLEFDGVCFGYEPDRPVLKKISFVVAPAQKLAIIGPSGAGKTTLMNLIPRFFDPQQGAVRLDGEDLRRIKLRDLRSLIAVVLQEPVLLPSTIADNIAYGRPGATLAEIEAAARAAGAHDFIMALPQQYQTPVGDGGARLSTGERQRLNLARAFLKDAPILLLDEPTSALDAESEALVVRSLFELMRGRTTLMIAHRLSTIQKVDQILVLQNGEVTERGAPAELLRQPDSYFARVVSGQVELA